MGLLFLIIELICYVNVYRFLAIHNANVAGIVKPLELKSKAKKCSSMAGQFAGWIMNLWALILNTILTLIH